MRTRLLIDNTVVEELSEPKTLVVYTRCPEKWMLVDKETGEVYTGHVTDGNNYWKKTEAAKWVPPNA